MLNGSRSETNITSFISECFTKNIHVFDAFLFVLIFVIAISGNVIVFICYFRYRVLRSITNVFIISLSVSDIFVAILSIPYTFGIFICQIRPDDIADVDRDINDLIYLTCDMLPSILSIHSLTLVALDRAFAITKPFMHRKYMNKNKASVAVVIVWVYTACLVSLIFTMSTQIFTVFIIIICYAVPVLIMIGSYIIMGYVARKHANELALLDKTANRLRGESSVGNAILSSNNNSPEHKILGKTNTNKYGEKQSVWSGVFGKSLKRRVRSVSVNTSVRHLKRELKAALTLSLILSCFILSWTPFIALNIEYSRCPECSNIPPDLVKYFKLLHYSNSALNPILYVLLNKRWRAAFRMVVCCYKYRSPHSSEASQSELFGW